MLKENKYLQKTKRLKTGMTGNSTQKQYMYTKWVQRGNNSSSCASSGLNTSLNLSFKSPPLIPKSVRKNTLR